MTSKFAEAIDKMNVEIKLMWQLHLDPDLIKRQEGPTQ